MIGINFFLKVEAPTIVGRSTGHVGECIIASSESGNTAGAGYWVTALEFWRWQTDLTVALRECPRRRDRCGVCAENGASDPM